MTLSQMWGAAAGGLCLALSLTGPATGQESFLSPEAEVLARQGLKAQVAGLRAEVEALVGDGSGEVDVPRVQQDLAIIAAILGAFPHLFGEGTSPDALAAAGSQVTTDAQPAIWDDEESFAAFADSIHTLALEAAVESDPAALHGATMALWDGCTSCHETYLNYTMDLGGGDVGDLDFLNDF
ncbi:cytochrome c [Pseudoroseicyclus tamaricis]|uniref:Cytochrome c n=1 Tax=Pseudoroseicyclus tamaricis TaxID=2705421 RepID=A0A6B2JX83_9RHOB|nr:cytochrome c [Pseudoroseicyclus tamaricis]NDV02828.1 cytochrome c [Pseudoroseicyclus tamaricis]